MEYNFVIRPLEDLRTTLSFLKLANDFILKFRSLRSIKKLHQL